MSESRSLKQKPCPDCSGYGYTIHDNGGDGSPQYPIYAQPLPCETCEGRGSVPTRARTAAPPADTPKGEGQ